MQIDIQAYLQVVTTAWSFNDFRHFKWLHRSVFSMVIVDDRAAYISS
jgi:hypothetical protein